MNTLNWIQSDVYEEMEKAPIGKLKMILGLWIDGKTYWMENRSKEVFPEENISVQIKKESIHSKVSYFRSYITNHADKPRTVKLLLQHRHEYSCREHFSFISPAENVIFHMADSKLFLVNGQLNGKKMEECTIQPYWNIYSDQIWTCRKKGILKYHPMAKGNATSVFSLDAVFDGRGTIEGESWIVRGDSKSEILQYNSLLIGNV
ncbi:hypothetical protein AF332_09645 [Sporosarcina globispora]|uniref:Uncharacterized protein n=1 Tax=Sporosarcina globispora TaxID=1459 RepID=A0A0M0GBB6_SPOGL|nr:hypothetical protein [Sporosarcina globispora]KON87048.1 hypothetical protein AF332_09645 [Sporosarcina globispora]